MSHRITTETEITDLAVAKQACEAAGWKFTEKDSVLTFMTGPLTRGTLNTKTGTFDGDTDYHAGGKVNQLKMHYAEALLSNEIRKQGGRIESRKVNQNGEVELLYQIG